jgi:hypothetical protein
VAVPCPAVNEDQAVTLVARWGEQFDVHPTTEAGAEGELSAEQVAGYVAKYAIKGTEAAAAQVGAHVRVCGHFSTKSRRYSTTLGALRRAGSSMPSADSAATRCRSTPGRVLRTTRR